MNTLCRIEIAERYKAYRESIPPDTKQTEEEEQQAIIKLKKMPGGNFPHKENRASPGCATIRSLCNILFMRCCNNCVGQSKYLIPIHVLEFDKQGPFIRSERCHKVACGLVQIARRFTDSLCWSSSNV